MSERHIELTWRCSSCREKNLGRHMACQKCGNPKDDSEEYEMPTDAAAVASVEDEKLLAMAKAGEHWKCAYCGHDQRDLDGGCSQCGAGRKEGANTTPAKRRASAADNAAQEAPRRAAERRFGMAHAVLAAIVAVAVLFVACALLKKNAASSITAPPIETVTILPVRTEFDGTVTSVAWTRSITVERWQLASHEDFTASIPEGAVEVKAAGQHFHHNEEVFDHDETVYDNVEVPDGTRTETYTERVTCGEDCTASTRSCRQVCTRTTRSCHQVCTNRKNGFASCNDVCTGGDQSCHEECTGSERRCTTKYCNETRTRQVPKTRTERRARIEKKYRTEAREAPWSTFKTWEWVALRTVDSAGDDASPTWPDAGGAAPRAANDVLADGGIKPGTERQETKQTQHMKIKTDDGVTHDYDVAFDESLLAPSSPVKVHIKNGQMTIDSVMHDN